MLEAKIIAVSDVIEAISSHRPYGEAHTVKEAIGEISKNKGILYDQ
jgi:HD-GYP domain-containing protein (c-di-GMP phosphodiesterase class II)